MNEQVKTKKVNPNTPVQKKDYSMWIMALGILVVIIFGYFYITAANPVEIIDKATTICITENSVFYGTEWCSFCQKQKEMFGTNVELLNYIDCDEDRDICVAAEISAFPSWDINGERYVGVQSEEKLKELTGC